MAFEALPASGLTESEVDARVTAGVLDFAETGNTDRISASKIPGSLTHRQAQAVTVSGSTLTIPTEDSVQGGDTVLFVIPTPWSVTGNLTVRVSQGGTVQSSTTLALNDRVGTRLTGGDVVAEEEMEIILATDWRSLVHPVATGSAFDLHEDVTTAISSLDSNDRFVVSDENLSGDPNRYVTLESVATKLAGTNLTASAGVLSASGGGTDLQVADEGSSLTTAATAINFAGAGVTATNSGTAVTVTIPGASGSLTVADPVLFYANWADKANVQADSFSDTGVQVMEIEAADILINQGIFTTTTTTGVTEIGIPEDGDYQVHIHLFVNGSSGRSNPKARIRRTRGATAVYGIEATGGYLRGDGTFSADSSSVQFGQPWSLEEDDTLTVEFINTGDQSLDIDGDQSWIFISKLEGAVSGGGDGQPALIGSDTDNVASSENEMVATTVAVPASGTFVFVFSWWTFGVVRRIVREDIPTIEDGVEGDSSAMQFTLDKNDVWYVAQNAAGNFTVGASDLQKYPTNFRAWQ